MELGADNAGQVQVADADSAAVIVGRASPTGGEFALAARYFTPTVVAMQADEWVANDLAPAYPNPANSAVNLPFRLAKEVDVELAIYNALGAGVRPCWWQRDSRPGRTWRTGAVSVRPVGRIGLC